MINEPLISCFRALRIHEDRCYRPRYLNVQRLNYVAMIRQGITGSPIT
jgi:hypothetical protein